MGSSGPPRWIPFGKPIPSGVKIDESFNSMAEATTQKMIAEENHSEFDSQRNDAISEAIKTENKKVFGGGTKQLQDANVQKIMDKGYTEEQAKTALRYNKNNVEMALNNLRKREERSRTYSDREESQSKTLPMRGKGAKDKQQQQLQEKPEGKPSTKISLFDFVEDKLPETTDVKPNAATGNNSGYNNNRRSDSYNAEGKNRGGHNRFENNISASFASRNQGPPYQQQNNYYNNARNDRSNDTRGGYQGGRRDYNENRNSGPPSRSNTYPGPRDKRYDNRDSYNSQQQHQSQHPQQNQGSYNNRYQKDYNNQAPQYSQKGDYRHERNDRTQNYHANSGGHDNKQQSSGGGYQRGGGGYNNSNYRDKNEGRAQGNNYASNNEYQSNATNKSHHQGQQQQQQQPQSGQQNHQSGSNKTYNDYSRGQRSTQSSNYSSKQTDHHQQRRSPPGQVNNAQAKPNNNQAKPYTKPNNNAVNMNQLVDATAQLKIGSSSGTTQTQQTVVITSASIPTKVPHPHQQSVVVTAGHQNHQQPPMTKNYVAIPNGTYNPYQIMGFQNKATNEFAMNVLKTQQLPVTANAQAPPPTVAVPVVAAAQMQPGQFVQQQYGHPPVIPSPQPMSNQFLPPGTTVAFNTVQVGMMPQVKFNVGEVCVAKYWEDERFYPAVITDVTEKTNVVRFVDYGNFEEVLKHDCLPLNTAPPGTTFSAAPATFKAVPVSAATQIIHPHGPPMPQHPTQHQQQNMRGGGPKQMGNSVAGNKPYREQRVYLPPQKRM